MGSISSSDARWGCRWDWVKTAVMGHMGLGTLGVWSPARAAVPEGQAWSLSAPPSTASAPPRGTSPSPWLWQTHGAELKGKRTRILLGGGGKTLQRGSLDPKNQGALGGLD